MAIDTSNTKNEKPKSKKNEINSLYEFIKVFYINSKNHTKPNKKTIKKLESLEQMTREEWNDIKELIDKDIKMEHTRKFLEFIITANTSIRSRLIAIATNILNYFKIYRVDGFIFEPYNKINIDAVISNIQSYKAKEINKEHKLENIKQETQTNAIYCLLIYCYLNNANIFDVFNKYINTFGMKNNDITNDQIILSLLSEKTNKNHLIVAINEYTKFMNIRKKEDDEKIHDLEKIINEIEKEKKVIREELSNKDNILKNANLEICSLKDTIGNNNVKFENEIANIKSKSIRSINDGISLIETGLEALKSSTPKPNITIDYSDRAISNLKKLIQYLKG